MNHDQHDNVPDAARRLVVGSMAGGILAAYASTASADTGTVPAKAGPASPMLKQNPATQYHQPPFKPQEQKWPGLASKMVPRPDHGETTYKGSGRLAGRKALITGGDSGIGRAAAIAFARERADVAFGYLPEEQEDADELVDLIKAAGQKACRRYPQ